MRSAATVSKMARSGSVSPASGPTAQQAAAGAGAPDERRVDDDSQRDEAGDLHDIFGRADAQERLDLKEARSLDASERDEVWILANNHPVARGEIEIRDDRIAITVTRPADVYDFMAGAA